MSFCTYLVVDNNVPDCIKSQLPRQPFLYRGKDSATVYIEYVISLANKIGKLLDKNIPMIPLT